MQPQIIQGFRLSPQQKRVWLLQKGAVGWSYRSRCVVEIVGRLESELFEKAIASAIRQHEILRTTFHLLPGMTIPVQAIDESVTLAFQTHDLTGLASTHQPAAIELLFKEATNRSVDFAHLPLLFNDLARLSDDRHAWIVSAPAVCADRLSLANFVEQVSVAYGCLIRGEEASFDHMQYADFAEWQNELLETEGMATGGQYWKRADLFENLDERLAFEKQTKDEDFQPESWPLMLDRQIVSRIQAMTIGTVPPSTFLEACWHAMLWRLTSSDLVIGRSFDGRKHEELAGAVGLFARFLPLKNSLHEELPFARLLKQVHDSIHEASRWQDYFSWDHVSTTDEDSGRHTFFPYCFELAPSREPRSVESLTFTIQEQDSCIDRFRLKLVCEEGKQELVTRLHYDASAFSSDAIDRLALNLQALIEDASNRPDTPIGDLVFLHAAERQRLCVDFNDNRRSYPSACVHELFESQAKQSPNQVAVVFENDTVTYQELNVRANQLAHHLRSLGVGPDVPVGLCLDRSVEMIVGLLGILKAGGAYLALDPALPKQRLRMMLEDAGARVLISETGLTPIFSDCDGTVVCLDANLHLQESTEDLKSGAKPENLVYVMFTSGSTGRPKGVAVEHRQLINYVWAVSERLDLSEVRSSAMVSTLAADLGNTVLFPSLLQGGTLHLISGERAANPEMLAEYFRRNPIDCLKIVPSHFATLLSGDAPSEIIPRQRLVLGGEACPWPLVEKIKAMAPNCVVFNHYGPTESTVGAVAGRVEDSERFQSASVPLGTSLANAQVYVLDKRLQPVPVGMTGELYIAGDGVARCYLNRAAPTAEKFIPNPFSDTPGARMYSTGDLGRYQVDGRLEFIGRKDNQVKIRGYRIELGEIEAALRESPELRQAIAIAREYAPGDRRLVAYLVAANHTRPSATRLRDFLKPRLPEYMIPSAFVFLDRFPLTANGKVDRERLPAPDDSQASQPFEPPRNTVEQTLTEIWSKVLGIEHVGIHDNFFELGGDSILSIQIISRANQAGLRLSPRQLFEHQTVVELAQVAGTSLRPEVDQGLVTGTVPLTPIQRRFFQQNSPEPHYYNQAMLLAFHDAPDPVLLEQAVSRLLVHHDALRLRFVKTETGWQQTSSLPDGTAPFTTFDLSFMTEAEAESEMVRQVANLHASLNLQDGPLLRVALFDGGAERKSRVFIAIHHLVVDTVSWQILLEDLQTIYEQLSLREDVTLPAKTTSFKKWAERLTDYANSDELRKELAEWLALSHAVPTRLPLDHPDGQNTAASSRKVSVSLSAGETLALLQEVPTAYRSQINEVLLTALVRVFSRWTGTPALLLDLEGHGREEFLQGVDLSRTVGWFTTIFPVALDAGGTATAGDALRVVKEQLRKIPNRGLGYGLLRYSSADQTISDSLQALPQAEVRFNYLGQRDKGQSGVFFSVVPGWTGPSQSPKGMRSYLLDIIGAVTNAELRFDWLFSENLHRRESVEQLANNYIEELRSLIINRGEGASLSPSDFPKARVSQADLNKVLSKLKRN